MNAKARFTGVFILAALFIGTTGFIASSRYNASLKRHTASGTVLDNPNSEITEKGRELIQEKLVTPIREKLGKTDHDTRIMSRCPSGVTYYIAMDPTEGSPYFTGEVYDYNGCQGTRVCLFRLSQDETTLEAAAPPKKEGDAPGYMPVDDFLKNACLKGRGHDSKSM